MQLNTFQSLLSGACPQLGEYIWNSHTWWRTTSAVFSNDVGHFCNRGHEIKHWVDNHETEFNRFVILDDNSDMEPYMGSLVLTDAYDGIGFQDFMKAERILKGTPLDE